MSLPDAANSVIPLAASAAAAAALRGFLDNASGGDQPHLHHRILGIAAAASAAAARPLALKKKRKPPVRIVRLMVSWSFAETAVVIDPLPEPLSS